MSGILERSFKVLEHLVAFPEGKTISSLAGELDLPLSATHRLLADLIQHGYVRQHPAHGHYMLTFKLVSLGLSYLSNSGIVDIAQPLLEHLAQVSGELVRLAVVDGDELTFVAKAQGARGGLRYDPDMGLSVNLGCSAAGHAWLSTLSDSDAEALVARQGFGRPEDFGRNAPEEVQRRGPIPRSGPQAGLQSDPGSVRAGDGLGGGAGARCRWHGHRCHHHRRTAPALRREPHAGVRARVDRDSGKPGPRQRLFGAFQADATAGTGGFRRLKAGDRSAGD